MDLLALRDHAIAALMHLDVDITDGEPETGLDGRIRRTVIVSVTPGTTTGRRASGGSVNVVGYVNAMVVTASRDSCLWLSEQVQRSLADLPLERGSGALTDESYDGEPLPEPNTSPARWSTALAFRATRKRHLT